MVCYEECDVYQREGSGGGQKQHLQERLARSRATKNMKAEQDILAIIKCSLGARRGGSVATVQVWNKEGTVTEYTDQDGIHQAIWENVQNKRFFLAEPALSNLGTVQTQNRQRGCWTEHIVQGRTWTKQHLISFTKWHR